MNAALQQPDDLLLLQESTRRALADETGLAPFTTGDGDAVAVARRHWRLATEIGWPGLLVPSSAGGAGMGFDALAVLAEEMGAHFFCGPFLATGVLGTVIADLAARHGKMPGLANSIAEGSIVLAAAMTARQPHLEIERGVIVGTCELVEHAELATHVLVLDGDARELRAALVPADSGIAVTPRQPLDVTCPVATLSFENVPIADRDYFKAVVDVAALLRPVHIAIAAELVGIARSALDRAVAFAKERRQFGQPIGAFQAIKHRLADAFVMLDHARLAVRHVATTPDDAAAVESARVLAADAALKAASDYIQVQGGMGISWESDAHLHLKRARRLAASFGSSHGFRRAIADRFIASVLTGTGRTDAAHAG